MIRWQTETNSVPMKILALAVAESFPQLLSESGDERHNVKCTEEASNLDNKFYPPGDSVLAVLEYFQQLDQDELGYRLKLE